MLKSDFGVPKLKTLVLLLLVLTGLVGSSLGQDAPSTPDAPITQFFQGFETDGLWGGGVATDPDRVASITHGVPSKTGSWHGEALAGDFTRWGGYNSTFPTNGYSTSVAFYLNMAGGYANDTRFDWSSAINDTTGNGRRDFIFTGGFYSDAGPYGSGPRFVFSASNNSPGDPRDASKFPVSVNTTGWYTLKHTFLKGSNNVLSVKMELINAAGTTVGTWFSSNPADVVGTTVGGNRYGWLVDSGFPFLAVDDSQRVDLDAPTVPTNTTVINHHDINNWLYYNDAVSGPEGPDATCGTFVTGPAPAPLGTGSAQISVSGTRRCNLATYQFAGTPLSAITTLRYSTYNPSAGNGGSANRSGYLLFNVDFDGSDTWQKRLNFTPSPANGTVLQNTWQEWDAINGGNAQWTYSGGTWPLGVGEPGTTPGTTAKTWSQILTTYPGVRIRVTDAHLGIRVGEPYADGYTENIDSFKFGTSAGVARFDFDPAAVQTVTPATSPTAFDNDYTRINNAIQAAPSGSTIILSGTFNWTEPNAFASWANGSNGLPELGSNTAVNDGAGDDYEIVVPPNRNNITLTAASLGSAIIQGPGDIPGKNLEGVFDFEGGPNQGWTISNLDIRDFDVAIIMEDGSPSRPVGVTAFNNTTITNNHILVAKDSAVDANQNIGIHYSFGTNQKITNNTIEIPGDGAGSDFGMQSNTSGGSVYDGLLIDGNTIRILNSPSNESVRGIWENGHAHTSKITVSNNRFINNGAVNNPATNQQRGFRITSHSAPGALGTQVTYSNNTVSGANIGFEWIPGSDFHDTTTISTVKLQTNTILNNGTGVLVQSQGQAILKGNRIVGNGVGVNNVDGVVAAEQNWWGCNFGPGQTGGAGSGCTGPVNGTSGTFINGVGGQVNDYLKLVTSANPSVIGLGDTSTVTSVFVHSTGSGSFTIPDGVLVAFAGTLGTVNPTSSTTSGGSAGTTFFTANAFGNGGVKTTVDSQFVNAPITITASCQGVSIPVTASPSSTPVTIPVNVADLTGRGIRSADFTVTYNSSVLTYSSYSKTAMTNAGLGSNVVVNMTTPGTLVIGVSKVNGGADPYTGAGPFINLNFSVIGAPGSVSNLNFAGFTFNEGNPCSAPTNGSLTVQSGSISGTVTYGNSLSGPGPATRHVPATTLSATGSVNVTTTTGLNGQYTLTGMGAGPYTVTASKTGDVFQPNTITASDASAAATYAVGLPPTLTANQLIVADVSGNGTVTSLDASMIATYAVGLPDVGQTGQWKFLPATRSYPDVNGVSTGQDYTALLMGDITGNWWNSSASAPISGAPGGFGSPKNEGDALMITAPEVSASSGAKLTIPVSIGETTDLGIRAYQFELLYDASVMEPAESPVDLAGSVSQGSSIMVNATEPGRLRVAIYGTQALTGKGDLLKLNFNVVGAVETSTDLRWENFLLNEGGINFLTNNGRVEVVASNTNGAINGRVLTPMGRGIANTRVTVVDSRGNATSVTTSSFGLFQVTGLQMGESYTVRVSSRLYKFASQTVALGDSAVNLDLIAQE